MPMTTERRRAIVAELVSRPGHEKVRTLVYELLVNELGATSEHIHFERRLPEVHGRADALLGRTVFEFKRDLRAEKADAEEELSRYIRDRQANTGDHFVGIATDGAVFAPYELRGNNLRLLREFRPNREKP